MTRLICVCSGKGGVGKTFLTSNLGIMLSELGKDVAILDANLTTPNLGIHLGIPLYPVTLHDVLKGDAKIQDAIYEHSSGLKIIPAGLSLKDLKGSDVKYLPNVILDLLGNVDILIMDSAAGLGRESLAAIESSDELLIVTNPELPAVTDALKALKLAEQVGTKITGVVVNRISGKTDQLSRHEVQNLLSEADIIAEIPEDMSVKHSISRRTPVVSYDPNSKASKEIRKLAGKILGYTIEEEKPWYRKLLGR